MTIVERPTEKGIYVIIREEQWDKEEKCQKLINSKAFTVYGYTFNEICDKIKEFFKD